MPICAQCDNRAKCHEICPPLKAELRRITRYQKEPVVDSEFLDYLAMEAQESGLICSNGYPSQRKQIRTVREWIETLDSRQEQIYYLYHIEGWTHERIAEEMGTSRQNISQSWKRIEKGCQKRILMEASGINSTHTH